MTTIVLTDVHLGYRACILATPAVRERLFERVAEADRVVLLGDLLSLRQGPVSEVIAAAAPFLEGLREVAGQVVIVPGNHDHRLAEPLLEGPADRRPEPLALERIEPAERGLAGTLARMLDGCETTLAYPGLWLREDVYAIHGHYLDCHITVPRPESLAAAGMKGWVGQLPAGRLTPDDYESVLAPIYAFSYRRAQSGRRNGRPAPIAALGRRARAQGWRRVQGIGGLAAGGLAVGAIAGLNRLGLGPFGSDLSLEELGRAGNRAMAEVVDRLGVSAEHVIFGHTHRAGTAGNLLNAGTWVHEPMVIGDDGERSPYWPGSYVLVEESGPPRLMSLMSEAAAR